MTRWERLEGFLDRNDMAGNTFMATGYAKAMDFEDVAEATEDIQRYLKAQRSKRSRTRYVLRRVAGTRTGKARWAVGTRTADAQNIGLGLFDDTRAKVKRAFEPDLVRIKALNPRAARRVDAQIDAVLDGAMRILEVAAQGLGGDEEE
jgi:hypothetical protein